MGHAGGQPAQGGQALRALDPLLQRFDGAQITQQDDRSQHLPPIARQRRDAGGQWNGLAVW